MKDPEWMIGRPEELKAIWYINFVIIDPDALDVLVLIGAIMMNFHVDMGFHVILW